MTIRARWLVQHWTDKTIFNFDSNETGPRSKRAVPVTKRLMMCTQRAPCQFESPICAHMNDLIDLRPLGNMGSLWVTREHLGQLIGKAGVHPLEPGPERLAKGESDIFRRGGGEEPVEAHQEEVLSAVSRVERGRPDQLASGGEEGGGAERVQAGVSVGTSLLSRPVWRGM